MVFAVPTSIAAPKALFAIVTRVAPELVPVSRSQENLQTWRWLSIARPSVPALFDTLTIPVSGVDVPARTSRWVRRSCAAWVRPSTASQLRSSRVSRSQNAILPSESSA